ncbi:peptidase 1 [Auriculariales sp. MPI-PUGE-AT-0066]|nr:peptidase 1 [Auriculariales sp. MPI-PUGE-AT-0066]
MRLFTSTVLVALFGLSVLAAPDKLLQVQRAYGAVNPHSYIVKLKPGACKYTLLASDPSLRAAVTHADWDSSILHGFAGVFDAQQLYMLRASAAVESIVEDGVVQPQTLQTDAAWGLARVSSKRRLIPHDDGFWPLALNYTYAYPDAESKQGEGVDIYILDTGVYIEHVDFEGRASHGWAAEGLDVSDEQGHGTHVAGIAAGRRWGVAKQANIISVKILQTRDKGRTADLISGLIYVAVTARLTGRPSIANLSVGVKNSSSIDWVTEKIIKEGVHVVVAAGNKNQDAAAWSPARVPSAITVGATKIDDDRWDSSNYGPAVDIWAPGLQITSASNTNRTGSLSHSGTSQAAPHVSGAVALWISEHGNAEPEEIKRRLWSKMDVVTGFREYRSSIICATSQPEVSLSLGFSQQQPAPPRTNSH